MSNTEKSNINNEKKNARHNEEETVTVEIEEIAELGVNINNTQINESENTEYNNDNQNQKIEIQNLDTELENVVIKSNELEQNCAVFQFVEKDQKSPSIWVQYNKLYSKRPPHQQFGGKSRSAPLSYDPESRNYFVKFVFIILFVMLSITTAYGVFVLLTDSVTEFYQDSAGFLMIVSSIVLLVMNYVMGCSACARVPPCNFIALIIVEIAMSNLVACVTVRYHTNILVLALISTLITVALCVLLACSNFDFTAWYIYVVLIAMVFMAISLVTSITMLAMDMKFKPLQFVLLIVGTIIQVVILIMELQMILGGRIVEMGEDDYALAAYLLYTSIVDIFLQIVQLLGLLEE